MKPAAILSQLRALGLTGRSRGVCRRKEDIFEPVTWTKATLIDY
jgi:hypothetical protein